MKEDLLITRDDLHRLIDQLPESEWPESFEAVEDQYVVHFPVSYSLEDAPEVPPLPGEIRAMEELEEEIREGKSYLVSHEEVLKRLQG